MDLVNIDLYYEMHKNELDSFGNDFEEYVRISNEIDSLVNTDDIILEAVDSRKGQQKAVNRKVKGSGWNAAPAVGAGFKAYNNITSAMGNLIKFPINWFSHMLGLIAKVAKFLTQKLADLPGNIVIMAKRLKGLGPRIMNRLRGGINLYITANDLPQLYQKGFMSKLHEFIMLSTSLIEKEVWNTKRGLFKQYDLKKFKRMSEIFKELKDLDFEPTPIDLRNEKEVNIYFGEQNIYEKLFRKDSTSGGNYYQALSDLLKDVKEDHEIIGKVSQELNRKFNEAKSNGDFDKTKEYKVNYIKDAVQQSAKIYNLVGKIVNYVNHDMNEINRAINNAISGKSMPDPKTNTTIRDNVVNKPKDFGRG